MTSLPARGSKASTPSTQTAESVAWDLADEVIAFRSWGASESFFFPAGVGAEWKVGSSSRCELCLKDPSGSISRHHATIRRVDSQWQIQDEQSKNGLSVDGVRCISALIAQGSIVSLGNFKLVAVNGRLIALREFLLRIMGTSVQTDEAVDETLQDIRFARALRDPLVLRGRGITRIARQLASLLLGKEAPFALHDTRRAPSDGDGDIRLIPNTRSLDEAIDLAGSGAVCIRSNQLSQDLIDKVAELRSSRQATPLLIFCDEEPTHLDEIRTAPPIWVPLCRERSSSEMERLIAEFCIDIAREFSVDGALSDEEHRWVIRNAETISEVERCLHRLLAFRSRGSLLGAAQLLGMQAVSLRRWFSRHPLERKRSETP